MHIKTVSKPFKNWINSLNTSNNCIARVTLSFENSILLKTLLHKNYMHCLKEDMLSFVSVSLQYNAKFVLLFYSQVHLREVWSCNFSVTLVEREIFILTACISANSTSIACKAMLYSKFWNKERVIVWNVEE